MRTLVRVSGAIGLVLALAPPAVAQEAAKAPPPGPYDATLSECFARQRSEPGAAIGIAEGLLRNGSLPVDVKIKALSCLGMASGIAGDGVRAVASATRIELLLSENEMPPAFTLRALSNAGAIFHAGGEVYRGLELYLRAYEVAAAAELDLVRIATLINIGLIHGDELGAYAEAENYFKRAQDVSTSSGHEDPLLAYNRAINYARMGRDADAMATLDLAAAAAARQGNKLFSYRALTERAGLLVRAGKGEEAMPLLLRAIAMQRALPDPAGESASLVYLAALQLAQGDDSASLESAQAAERLVLGAGFRKERRLAMNAQVAALRALGEADMAFEKVLQLHELELDGLRAFNRQGIKRQARLQEAAREREVEGLRQVGEIQSLKLANARRLRNFAIAGVVLLLAVGSAFAYSQRRIQGKLRSLSRLDGLTGLMNRRAAASRLDGSKGEEMGSADVRGVVLLIDVDHFKAINDQHGHGAGDRALIALSDRMKSCCRPDDIVARWGGEEFMIACQRVTLEQAQRFAERLRAVAANTPVTISETEEVPLKISIGFAPYPFHESSPAPETWHDAIRLADRSLYAAKNSGRDMWVGLWGHGAAVLDINAILESPERAAATDSVEIVSLRPVVWSEATGDGGNG